MQAAAIDQRGDSIFVYSNSETISGLWVHSPPFIPVPIDTPNAILGHAIRDALGASKQGVEYDPNERWELGGLAKVAGMDSWKDFVKGTRHCAVRIRHGKLKLVPYQNRGPRLGFYELTDGISELPLSVSDEALGEAARSTLETICR